MEFTTKLSAILQNLEEMDRDPRQMDRGYLGIVPPWFKTLNHRGPFLRIPGSPDGFPRWPTLFPISCNSHSLHAWCKTCIHSRSFGRLGSHVGSVCRSIDPKHQIIGPVPLMKNHRFVFLTDWRNHRFGRLFQFLFQIGTKNSSGCPERRSL